MAGAAHISPYHVSRLFKESRALTSHRYVNERRGQRAKELYPTTPGTYPRILTEEADYEMWSIESHKCNKGDAPSDRLAQFSTH